MIYLYVLLALLVGFVLGFVVVALRVTVKPSGILHIKQTDDKDYYTIEITDDFDSIPEKKDILLRVKVSREIHTL